MLDLVAEKLHEREHKPKLMVLPHCTWDKFGDLLASGGGRCLGLFEEMMSFFATMNMYYRYQTRVNTKMSYKCSLEKQNIVKQAITQPITCK